MARDNKGIADAIVVSMSGNKKEPEEMEEDAEGETSELEMASTEILEAIQADDATALSDALKSFIKLCKYEKEGD
jgi:hypothetical protein